MSVWFNYATKGGYSLDDGLGEGRWVTVPNSGGLVKWVGQLEMGRKCPDCPNPISDKAIRCQSCARRRRYEKQVETEVADLIACPECLSAVGKHCVTSTGRHRAPHSTRLVERKCQCGGVLGKGKKVCDSCRTSARRENGRRGMQNTRARRRDEAA